MRAALLALVLLLAASAGAAAAPIVSLQDDDLVNVSGPALEARLDALAATGAKATRVDVLWREVARARPADARDPADPAYDWSRYDQIVRGLAARGVAVLLDFYLTPEWASRSGAADGRAAGGRRRPLRRGARAALLGDVRRDRAARSCPRCAASRSGTSPTSRASGCRSAGAGAAGGRCWSRRAATRPCWRRPTARSRRRTRARSSSAGWPAPPAARPRPAPSDGRAAVGSLDFARLVADEGPPIDAWSMHIYPIGSPLQAFFVPSWSTLPQVIRQVDRLAPGAPIHVTETGYHTSYNRFHRYFVSEDQQAAWVDETLVAAARSPRVQLVTWFNFQDNPRWTGGLLRADGTRKPSYARFAAAAAAYPPPPGWGP